MVEPAALRASRRARSFTAAWLAGALLLGIAAVGRAEAPAVPPAQPAAGPGGVERPHAAVRVSRGGKGGAGWWIFEPADPAPKRAPVVVFLHGWASLKPDAYEAWIRHLARGGHVVVFPRYQASLLSRPARMTDDAAEAVRDALQHLDRPGRVRPDRDRVAYVGHSMGGVIAANLAGRGPAAGLPAARALFVVQPGDLGSAYRVGGGMLEDPARIPGDCLLLAFAGDRDDFVGDRRAREIHDGARSVPPGRKALVVVRSDEYGRPPLVADHYFPLAPMVREGTRPPPGGATEARGVRAVLAWAMPAPVRRAWLDGLPPDALDWHGTWGRCDRLLDAAFRGGSLEAIFGVDPESRVMGRWSDGTPVRALERGAPGGEG